MKDCNGARIQIGDWGGKDPDIKLTQCADAVRSDSRCGVYFFFRSDKGRCFCEAAGATCNRYQDVLVKEYRIIDGL